MRGTLPYSHFNFPTAYAGDTTLLSLFTILKLLLYVVILYGVYSYHKNACICNVCYWAIIRYTSYYNVRRHWHYHEPARRIEATIIITSWVIYWGYRRDIMYLFFFIMQVSYRINFKTGLDEKKKKVFPALW